MADMLSTAVSGLLTYQRALSTTSHNISNVNTPGYSRQSVDINARTPIYSGGLLIGSGSNVDGITRSYDQFIATSLRESSSAYHRLEKFTQLAGQIDNILADPQGGISPILQDFFTTIQDVADDPASGTARLHMINTANALVNRFNTFDTRLEQLSTNTATDVTNVIDEINGLVAGIREVTITLNELNASGDPSQQSADLLDQRDALLDELSTKVSIQVINDSGNNLTIQVGNGQTMLSGSTAFRLRAQPDLADPSQDIIVYDGLPSVVDVSAQLSGGELGGLLDYRSSVLIPSRNTLGRIAIGLADSLNTQHRQGMDLEGNLGGDFFTFGQPQMVPFTSNTGTSSITTTITDVSQLTVEDYELSFDGASWTLVSGNGSSSPAVADASPANTTLVFEGLTVVVDGTSLPAAGDRFTIKPTRIGAQTIDVALNDPNLIAAAVPVRTLASLNNLGNARISQGIVTDSTNSNLLNTVTFTFNSPATTFTSSSDVVVGGATFLAGAAIPFSNNMVVDSNGWQVTLSGTPQANDSMTVEANLGGTGDNRNALALANLQTTGLFNRGVSNYQEAYSSLVGEVGSIMNSAEVERVAQQALLTQAQDQQSSKSGVNLDEEAADLIKFQQAYEATARIISVAQTLFDSLIASTR